MISIFEFSLEFPVIYFLPYSHWVEVRVQMENDKYDRKRYFCLDIILKYSYNKPHHKINHYHYGIREIKF